MNVESDDPDASCKSYDGTVRYVSDRSDGAEHAEPGNSPVDMVLGTTALDPPAEARGARD